MTAPIAQALTDTANLAALVKPKTEENGSASIFDDLVVTLSHVDGSDGAQSKSSPGFSGARRIGSCYRLESNTAQPPAGIDAANVAGARVSSGGAIQPGSAPTDSAAQDNRAAALHSRQPLSVTPKSTAHHHIADGIQACSRCIQETP